MVNPATKYHIIGVKGTEVRTGVHEGAPSESWLCAWGMRRQVDFVIRYFPSRKGWRVLDIRDVISVMPSPHSARMFYTGQRHSKFYGTEDAAVMVAIHMGGQQPHPQLDL